MAKKFTKFASRCESAALMNGSISPSSSATPLVYDISRHWRALLDATDYKGPVGQWSEREEAAGEVVLSALAYLKRIGCKDIERLLNDLLGQHARH